MDYLDLVKKNRRKPIAEAGDMPKRLRLNRGDIARILPHRGSMLLVDEITGIDLERGIITGSRYMDPEDPVFAGHFPGTPVYPGSLQVEMIGQLGLCLYYFITHSTDCLGPDATPVDVRATRVLGAQYAAPLTPGVQAEIVARKLDYDGFFATALGQVVADGTVTTAAALEVVFPD